MCSLRRNGAFALFVDVARIPVYLATQGGQLARIWILILVATVGVLVGTVVGGKALTQIKESVFRRVVSVVITLLGVAVLAGAIVR